MDNIWKNTAKKVHAHKKCTASHITATSTTAVKSLPTASPPTTPLPTAFDPEMSTLEELKQMSQRLQQDWPKEDGIPFPANIFKTLGALRVAVIARDTRKGLMAVQPIAHTTPVQSTETATKTVSKKATKKRRLHEQCAAAHTTASPTAAVNPPATIIIVLNVPITADYSPTQIGADTVMTATAKSPPASILPHVNHDVYDTAQPKQLYSLLITAAATPPCSVINALADQVETVTKPLNPADYSLKDIDAVLSKIQKQHGRTEIPIPESVQETAKALR
jgi:hypothetical protein